MKKIIFFAGCLAIATSSKAQIGVGTTAPNSTMDVRGSVSAANRAFTGTTSITAADYAATFTGTVATTATLPDATTCTGRMYVIKNASGTLPVPVLTINTTASQTIDGQASWLLDEPNESIMLASNGTNWVVYNQATPTAKTGTTGGGWNEGGNRLQSTKAIGTIANFDLPILTNNTEKLRITSAGNVGIGTTNPLSKLELSSGVANTSGLKFTNMNSTSPVTSCALLGIDTAGKIVVAASSYQARTNYVIVKSVSDFPAPSAGVITLAANSIYEVNGTVVVTNKIDLNGSTIRGASGNVDILVYPLTSGELFTGAVGGSLSKLALVASGVGSKVFNIDAAGANKNMIIENCFISSSNNIGVIKGFAGTVYLQTIGFLNNTNGLTIQNDTNVVLSNLLWDNTNHNTYLKLVGNFSLIQILGGDVKTASGTSAVGLDVSGITGITAGAALKTVLFTGPGTYVNGSFSNKWEVEASGINTEKDGVATGDFYMSTQVATNFSAINTPTKVLGATTSASLFRVTSPTDNRLTYTGTKTRDFQVIASLTATQTSSNKFFSFYITKNGTTMPQSRQEVKIINSTDQGAVTLSCIVTLAPNDYIELWVENETATTSLTVQTLNMAIK